MPASGVNIPYSETAVIIPAYNPGETLLPICLELVKKKISVFVVNDGSTDTGMFNSLLELPVVLLHHSVNLGQGAALETGICKALSCGKSFFVTLDADGQHSTSSVDDLLEMLMQPDTDIIFGSRFLNKVSRRTIPSTKRITLKLAALFDGLLTGIWLTDSHNGLRAFSRQVAAKIHFTENRMAHATEILWLTKKWKWKYRECAVLIHYNKKSQHPSRSIEIAIDLFLRKLIS